MATIQKRSNDKNDSLEKRLSEIRDQYHRKVKLERE